MAGHGRMLLGGGKAVLEGGDLGHQVALGQECVAQLGLGFQRGVTLAAQSLDLIDHGHGLGMELDDLPVEFPSIGEISDARGMELVVLELEARGIEFELLLYKGDPLIAVGLKSFVRPVASTSLRLNSSAWAMSSAFSVLRSAVSRSSFSRHVASIRSAASSRTDFTPDVSLIFFSLGLSVIVRHSNQQWAWLRHAKRLETMHGRC
ncbi:MAG: hypothetical protein ACLU0O_13025 [Collinsella sp.]